MRYGLVACLFAGMFAVGTSSAEAQIRGYRGTRYYSRGYRSYSYPPSGYTTYAPAAGTYGSYPLQSYGMAPVGNRFYGTTYAYPSNGFGGVYPGYGNPVVVTPGYNGWRSGFGNGYGTGFTSGFVTPW